jgi:hypothetical protein
LGDLKDFDAEVARAFNVLEGVENLPERVKARVEVASANLDPLTNAALVKSLQDGRIEQFTGKGAKKQREADAKNDRLPRNAILHYLNKAFSPKVGVRMLAYDLATLDPTQKQKRVRACAKRRAIYPYAT